MPNRILKESICTSDKINSLSDFHFRLWTCLITYVDDYGRGDARAAIIKGRCFPLLDRVTVKDIEAGLHVLAGTGCIILYEVDGESYLCFPNWDKHQTVRNHKSKYPAPQAADNDLKEIEINCKQLQADASKCPRNPIQSESESNPNPIRNSDPPKRFTPPTLEEVTAYCKERNNNVNPQKFIDFYESKGWMVGKTKMKDWKASVRTWESGDKKPAKTVTAQQYEQRDYAKVQDDIMRDFDRVMDNWQNGGVA